jgi:hypothetical protein
VLSVLVFSYLFSTAGRSALEWVAPPFSTQLIDDQRLIKVLANRSQRGKTLSQKGVAPKQLIGAGVGLVQLFGGQLTVWVRPTWPKSSLLQGFSSPEHRVKRFGQRRDLLHPRGPWQRVALSWAQTMH